MPAKQTMIENEHPATLLAQDENDYIMPKSMVRR